MQDKEELKTQDESVVNKKEDKLKDLGKQLQNILRTTRSDFNRSLGIHVSYMAFLFFRHMPFISSCEERQVVGYTLFWCLHYLGRKKG